jgi:hypothetical protein
MQATREQIATDAYIALLASKGVDAPVLASRKGIINKLSNHLTGKALDGAAYRQVIEHYIENVPAEDWPLHLATAREYYHFWVEDIKKIALMNRESEFPARVEGWQPEVTTLKALTDRLKAEKFEASEIWPIKAYQQALRQAGAGPSLIETRLNLAKIVMMRMRPSPVKNRQSYRTVVDSTMPLFRIKNSRRLFLEVVREFYHFWSGNPEAANLVLLDH